MPKARRSAFTLIELLVVIAIIALLVSILLPSLGRAKELAKRAVCSGQLHALGVADLMFASEQDGLLPRCGGSATQGHQTRPTTIPDSYDNAGKTWDLHGIQTTEFGIDKRTGVAAWQGHGTSISTYMELGMPDPRNGGFDCPSSVFTPDYRVAGGTEPEWKGMGARWLTDYTIISGIHYVEGGNVNTSPGLCYAGEVGWLDWDTLEPLEGVAVPAYSTEDENASGEIIGADRVEDHQGNDSDGLYGPWGIYSNHDPQGPENDRPTYQNIVYGDGHVANIGLEVYKLPIGANYADWSHRAGGGNPDGNSGRWKYHWWGQAPD